MLKASCVCLFPGFAVPLTQLIRLQPSISEKEESQKHYGPACFLNKMCPVGGEAATLCGQRVWFGERDAAGNSPRL